MYYKHQLNYEYPTSPDEHMITVKQVRHIDFDESYEYMPRGFKYKFMRVIYWLGINIIVFPLMRLTHGLRIFGRENIKKHRKSLKEGAITVANHVFYWDYLCVLKAIRPHLAYFPAWKDNLEGPCGKLIRLSGGIPVPDGNFHAMIKFNKAIESAIKDGKWVHFFAEGSMWFFYPDIRPLKKAVFHYAVKFDKPVIPVSMSFRPRKGIMKLFGKKPLVDLHVAEPIFPDKTLEPKAAEEEIRRQAYHIMQVMNGINPTDPSYNTVGNPAEYKKTM